MSSKVKSLDEQLKQLNCDLSIRQSLLENNITTIEQFVDVKDFSRILPWPWMELKVQHLQSMLDPTKSSAEKKQEIQLREQKNLEEIKSWLNVEQAKMAAKSTLPQNLSNPYTI